MEEQMVDDAANEDELEFIVTVYEIDLDYEFDAARFFDFEKDESPEDARRAELWFDSAGSYPPSPFVENLVPGEELLLGNINVSPKSKGVGRVLSGSDSDVEADHEPMEMNSDEEGKDKGTCNVHIGSQQKFRNHSQNLPSGLTFYNHMANTLKSESQSKQSGKSSLPRASTLMRPTASQLAKQNHPFQAGYSRSNLPVFEKASKSSTTGCVIENQAAKRQKLEGGLLRKVAGADQLQQTNFVHKVSKRDGILDGNKKQSKLRITIPRDQHLETACRAQRLRSNSSTDDKGTSTVGRFKALPLNRKILEAPSMLPKRSIRHQPDFQEFHLKTSVSAVQHGSAVLNSSAASNHFDKDLHKHTSNFTKDYGNKVPGRSGTVNTASRTDGCLSSHGFKALPLNKKILRSKGDIGIFRNIKKETTVPMEFNFQTEKRCHDNNPPTNLFNKLSLSSEAKVTKFEPKVPRSLSTPAKGSKENGWGSFQQGNEIKQSAKLKPSPLMEKKLQFSSNTLRSEVSGVSSINWRKPIR